LNDKKGALKVNWKVVFIGGLIVFVVSWLIAPITGPLIHNGVLRDAYMATASTWRPELMQDPPNMAALLPYWITVGLVTSFIAAGIYDVVRPAFAGPGWLKGVKFAIVLSLLAAGTMLAFSGVFNLPNEIWFWWAVEWTAMYLLSGAALGWFAERYAGASMPSRAVV
jgi:hypothetical protein